MDMQKHQVDPRDFMNRMMFVSEMKSKVRSLDFQRERIFERRVITHGTQVSPVHDADFYVILLRRLYRQMEKKARHDSRVANLKGKYRELVGKIKMRDHFEHGFDPDKLTPTDTTGVPGMEKAKGVVIMTSVFLEKGFKQIVSGNFRWDLDNDHEQFVQMMDEMVALYPFAEGKAEQSDFTGADITLS